MSKRQSIREDIARLALKVERLGARVVLLEEERARRGLAVPRPFAVGGFVGYSTGDAISSPISRPISKPIPVEHLDATAFGRRVRVRAGDGSFIVTGHLVGYRFDTEVTESPLIGHGPVGGLVTITLTIDDHEIDAHPGDGTTVTYLDNPKERA